MKNNTNLVSLAAKEKSISIAGISKNAGKTTVLNFLIKHLPSNCRLGLTSVGYDGEDTDLVTKTKKPKIFINKGTLVATAEKLLKRCTASRELLYRGDYTTPLGQIVIFRAKTSGFVQLGGPSIGNQLKIIKEILFSFGADKVIIDGALDRRFLSSADITDSAILSSGASYDKDIDKVVADTAAAANILLLKKLDLIIKDTSKVSAYKSGVELECGNLTPLDIYKNLGADIVYLGGAITKKTVLPLIRTNLPEKQRILAAYDASKIMLGEQELSMLTSKGIALRVLKPINLIALTCNPSSAYGYSFDPDEFYDKLKADIKSIPIFDVVKQGIAKD